MRVVNLICTGLVVVMAGCVTPKEENALAPCKCFSAMEQIRATKPVDFDALREKYEACLQSYVVSVAPSIDTALAQAFELGGKGTQPHVQSQRVSKQLQKACFRGLFTRMAAYRHSPDAQVHEEIAALYECLSPTVVRRGEWLGRGRELDDRCRHALAQLQHTQNSERLENAQRSLEQTLITTYVASVMYELAGIAEYRGSNQQKCEEKEVEGRLFFEIVKPFAESDSLVAVVEQELHAPYVHLDVERARALMAQLFPDHMLAGERS